MMYNLNTVRSCTILVLMFAFLRGEPMCEQWWEPEFLSSHVTDDGCRIIQTNCFINTSNSISERAYTLCGIIQNLTRVCTPEKVSYEGCDRLECYKSLGHLSSKLPVNNNDTLSNQALVNVIETTLKACTHNTTLTKQGKHGDSNSTNPIDAFIYIFILVAGASCLLGVVMTVFYMWIGRLKKHKRLCFAEREEPCKGKWEGASQKVTMKILQKHHTRTNSQSSSESSCCVKSEAYSMQEVNKTNRLNKIQATEEDTITDIDKVDIERQEAPCHTMQTISTNTNDTEAIVDPELSKRNSVFERNLDQNFNTTSDNIVDTSDIKNQKTDKQVLNINGCQTDPEMRNNYGVGKNKEFRLSTYYEVSRDSVTSECVSFVLSNENFLQDELCAAKQTVS